MNTLLLGLAWQRGAVPVGEAAILRAVELNGASVKLNKRAFLWGRILAERPELAAEVLGEVVGDAPASLADMVETRATALRGYQSRRYADRYRTLVLEVQARETEVFGQPGRLTRAAAEGLFRVMAYKDEYEVARLHAAATYGPGAVFHMSPPLLHRHDKATGRRGKIAIPGRVAMPLFRLMRHGKVLRGTPLDPFGYQAERKAERGLIGQYVGDLRTALAALRPDTLEAAVGLAELPDTIRGFGPVKDANRVKAEARRTVLLDRLNGSVPMAVAAE
jgi:indolepyruvate ferredoxin oxidoreductase